MSQKVGIDAMAVAMPRRYLSTEDLARARGVDPAKYTVGLGVKEMAVAEPGEDSAALAATAAERLLRLSGADQAKIGMLVVGTETGVDHAKAVASYVQGMLGLHRNMRTFDLQHACYGGTAALMSAVGWVGSGMGAGRTALVICTDIARYDIGSAGEPTQGAGAVAMLVSESPRLLELDLGVSGASSTDVHDFWRPLGRREALVDGHYSIRCYLDAVSGAWREWKAIAARREILRGGEGLPSETLTRIAYHVPFPKMAKKAHAHVRRCDLEDLRGKPFAEEEEAEPSAKTNASFEAQVASSLSLCSRVGNLYTGSLYLGLAGLLHAEGKVLEGKRIGLFSYGSGCCGEFYSGVLGKSAVSALFGIDEAFAARERIGMEEYERLMRLPYDGALEGVTGPFRFVGYQDHKRVYKKGER